MARTLRGQRAVCQRWLKRHGPCCPVVSWMDSRRVAGFTCGALDVGFPHFIYQRSHLRRQRQQVPVLATAGYDVARVMTWNFSNVPEMAPVAVHRHCPIVQDSTGCSMFKHSLRSATAGGFGLCREYEYHPPNVRQA
jgi:hypothetical protein